MVIFKSKQYSYRDLPVRISDLGTLHRNEVSGAIGGLTRCRSFCQDDGHIFLPNTGKSINEEICSIIDLIRRVYKVFEMDLRVVLATRPEKYMGSLGDWEVTENALFSAIMQNKLDYTSDTGGGAFYGPKIDFFVKDSLGREWQTATIQLDYQLPEKFELMYQGEIAEYRPVVIHRAMYGSFERFIGILLEHYQGELPLWLAPVQIVFLPVSEKHASYCRGLEAIYRQEGLRVAVDATGTLGNRIRLWQDKKIPYLLVAGDREIEEQTVTPRLPSGKTLEAVSWNHFLDEIKNSDVNF